MSAQVISIFDHPRKKKHTTSDDALRRWQTATACGDDAAAFRAQIDFYTAWFATSPVGDRPCDTE